MKTPTPLAPKDSPLKHVQPLSSSHDFSMLVQLGHALKIIATTAAGFIGAQLTGATLVALAAVLLFGVPENKLGDVIESNVYVRFATTLCVELLTVWIVFKFVKQRNKRLSDIGMQSKPTKTDLKNGLIVYVAYFAIFIAVFTAVRATHIIDTNQRQQLGFDNPQGLGLLLTFVALVILPPIAEEVLFRGFLFFGLKERIKPAVAAIITSLLFGAAHLEFASNAPLNWAAGLDTFVLSCVLCYAVHKYNSIWPAILTHALKNAAAFTLLFVVK